MLLLWHCFAVTRTRYFIARFSCEHASGHFKMLGSNALPRLDLRALQTVPNLTIHYGHLLSKTKRRPLAEPTLSGPRTVEVLDTEEKGSDVNLATYLLLDGFDDEYEMAVVISNDSDLELPIRKARTRLGKRIGVFDPSRKRSFELHSAASWYRPLRRGPLSASLFPSTLSDARGTITKPAGW